MAEPELSEEYLMLLLEILEVAAQTAIKWERKVSQEVLKKAVKPPEWRAKNEKEKKRHLPIKNKKGRTIGWVDKESPLVKEVKPEPGSQIDLEKKAELYAEADSKKAERKAALSSALVIGGAAFVGVGEQKNEGGQVTQAGHILSQEEAKTYMQEAGWQWVDESSPDIQAGSPAYIQDIYPVYVPEGVNHVVATNSFVLTPAMNRPKVEVAGFSTVDFKTVDGWDKDYREPVEQMSKEQLEEHFDMGYEQMILESQSPHSMASM